MFNSIMNVFNNGVTWWSAPGMRARPSRPTAPESADMMSWACTRPAAWTLAAVYVGLMMVFGLVSDITGDADRNSWVLYVSLPGSVLLYVFVAMPLTAAFGHFDKVIAEPFGSLIWSTLDAVVNVLLVWGAVSFCRVGRAEWRR
ncbi:hypothetical protein [Streptomyces albipurpureus]|uniref:Integral membrane protein n=1 Tax=Streptomyces albipurpureus TaxID=2897419 RepID=A0ABT0V093_9ACTN|nr:hypothetical protein [Streptomyces sp. CWNU-1]MCM2393906.1 hypothetical protein [Streptomyces sp. CWNU-1]